jgi:hypothetical protein
LQQLNNKALVEQDKNIVCDHVKGKLFEKTGFIRSRKSLEKGSKLHKDYLNSCQAVVANGELAHQGNEEAETYMNLLWVIMEKDHCYNRWLATKRSNIYQAMNDSFQSKYSSLS